MRTYLALKERAAQWAHGRRHRRRPRPTPRCRSWRVDTVGAYSAAAVDELLAEQHDLDALGARECRNERLDQLAVDLILGLR